MIVSMVIYLLSICNAQSWLVVFGINLFCIDLDWQHGGDINATDHTGQTALHWSAVRGAIQVAELLLQEGARVNSADMNGYQVSLMSLCFCL